jgi:hypothetical protein
MMIVKMRNTNRHEFTRIDTNKIRNLIRAHSCNFVVIRVLSFGLTLTWMCSSAAPAQTTAPTTAPSFEVHEWVVLVSSPFQSEANQDGMVLSTLPASADSRRQSAPAEQQNDPQPIGVIRLVGKAGAPVDVSITVRNGKMMAAWPKAKSKSNRLLWSNLNLSTELPATASMEGQSEPDALDANSWLNDLRRERSNWLRGDDSLERFLAYDLELDYTSPLTIHGGRDFSYELINQSLQPMRELNLYKPDGAGWRHAEIDQLGGPAVATKPTATTGPSATSQASAAAPPAAKNSAKVTLDGSSSTQAAEVLGSWKERLMGDGLPATDADLIIRILGKYALDPKRLTAVYELDAAQMDQLLPLEILPEPSKTVRVGLVVLRDADPGVAGEIDELVTQLGDDEWTKRDAAYQALAKLGKAAKSQLEKAQNSKDMEVVWRAERLLEAMNGATPAANQ